MIGKPYAGDCEYGLMTANRTSFHRRFETGTQLETADTAKDQPKER